MGKGPQSQPQTCIRADATLVLLYQVMDQDPYYKQYVIELAPCMHAFVINGSWSWHQTNTISNSADVDQVMLGTDVVRFLVKPAGNKVSSLRTGHSGHLVR